MRNFYRRRKTPYYLLTNVLAYMVFLHMTHVLLVENYKILSKNDALIAYRRTCFTRESRRVLLIAGALEKCMFFSFCSRSRLFETVTSFQYCQPTDYILYINVYFLLHEKCELSTKNISKTDLVVSP